MPVSPEDKPSPPGSEVLRTRVEQVRLFFSGHNHLICQVITTFNTLMEESQSFVERMRKEAQQLVARMEAAEARRQEELEEEMGRMIKGLEKDMQEMVDQVGFVVD